MKKRKLLLIYNWTSSSFYQIILLEIITLSNYLTWKYFFHVNYLNTSSFFNLFKYKIKGHNHLIARFKVFIFIWLNKHIISTYAFISINSNSYLFSIKTKKQMLHQLKPPHAMWLQLQWCKCHSPSNHILGSSDLPMSAYFGIPGNNWRV